MSNTAASTYGTAHFVSVQRAAQVLGLSDRSVQRYCREGAIPAKRIGRGRYLIPVSQIRSVR